MTVLLSPFRVSKSLGIMCLQNAPDAISWLLNPCAPYVISKYTRTTVPYAPNQRNAAKAKAKSW